MILAAAIAFEIKKTGKGVVLCGARYSDIFRQLESLGFGPKDGYEEMEQGFVDSYGNFLNRKEAYEHAKVCGQLSSRIVNAKMKTYSKELTPEDLW